MRRIIIISILLFIVIIFATPRLPLQDYADWMYQGKVFQKLLVSDSLYSNNYSLAAPIIPNSGSTAIMGCLDFVFPPDWTGRIFVALTFVFLYLGLRRLFSAKETPLIVSESLALFFAPSIFYFYGLLSYNIGLGIFLMLPLNAIASNKWPHTILKYSLIFLLLYYIHFIIMLCSVAVIIMNMLKRDDYRKITPLQLLLSLLPVVILFSFYYLNQPSQLRDSTIWGYSLSDKFRQYFKAFENIYQYNHPPSAETAILIFCFNSLLLVSLGVMLIYLAKDRFKEIISHKNTQIGIAFVLGAFATPYYIRGFGYSGDRFFWIGGIFIIAGILSNSKRYSRVMIMSVFVFSLSLLAIKSFIIVKQGIEDKKFENALMSRIPGKTSFMPMMLTFDYPQFIPPLTDSQIKLYRICPLLNTMNRIPYYILACRNQVYKGIFKTGILRPEPFDCDPISLIEGNSTNYGCDCMSLLLISPNGFADNLKRKLQFKYKIIEDDKEFILAAKTN